MALGLMHILDSITDLKSDEMIHSTFEMLGSLLDASAHGSFAQRKNPCLFLMNKMEQHQDPSNFFSFFAVSLAKCPTLTTASFLKKFTPYTRPHTEKFIFFLVPTFLCI